MGGRAAAIAGPRAPAPQLFRDRAGAVGAVPDDAMVARIVERLDGLPLAIEMAAAQLDTTTAEELAEALDEHLDGLRSPHRRVASRHRSLADLVAWSEARLDDDEARTLAELSLFAGPVIAADIVGVLGQPGVVDNVRQLARRSLVNVDRSRTRRVSTCSRRSARSPANASPRPVAQRRWRDATQSGSSTSFAGRCTVAHCRGRSGR